MNRSSAVSCTYRERAAARRKRWSANANAAKARKRMAEVGEMTEIGTIYTSGVFGAHSIHALARSDRDERWLYIVCDHQAKRPRTLRGVLRCLAKMVYEQRR